MQIINHRTITATLVIELGPYAEELTLNNSVPSTESLALDSQIKRMVCSTHECVEFVLKGVDKLSNEFIHILEDLKAAGKKLHIHTSCANPQELETLEKRELVDSWVLTADLEGPDTQSNLVDLVRVAHFTSSRGTEMHVDVSRNRMPDYLEAFLQATMPEFMIR